MKTIFKRLSLLLVLIVALIAVFGLMRNKEPDVSAITREGIIKEVQALSQLHTVAYSIDTVITASKEGSWQMLWQDSQKGLFVAHGRATAGVDLSKIGEEMVQVSHDKQTDTTHITISLPPTELFAVYLDDIQVYDWQTGVFGMVDNDPQILAQAQNQGKLEVLKKACAGGIMQMASDNAVAQVQALFAMSGAKVTVISQGMGACQLS